MRSIARVWLILFAGVLAICVAYARAPSPLGLSQYCGLLLALLGLFGLITAHRALGNSFSATPQARQLVTRGIYSKLRNPIYVSGTILIAGLILMLRQPYFWIALGAVVIVQVIRARAEAHVLEEKFGDEYRRYRDLTWF